MKSGQAAGISEKPPTGYGRMQLNRSCARIPDPGQGLLSEDYDNKKRGYRPDMVRYLEPVHDHFTAAPSRKRVSHKANDAGNNGLFPKTFNAVDGHFPAWPGGFRALPAAADVTNRLWYTYHGSVCALASIRHCPERCGEKIVNRLLLRGHEQVLNRCDPVWVLDPCG